jgi:uncharacterized protein
MENLKMSLHWRLKTLCLTALIASTASVAQVQNRPPLQPNAFLPLPLGAIKPQGWLERQEKIQARGLTGHLDEFWNDVGGNSGWLGGTGESWERGPYYLDGLLPLAYQLNDTRLIAKAKKWVEWTLQSQGSDGQFGPRKNDDWWPRMVMLKVLTQYAEVTGDAQVEPFLKKYFAYELSQLPNRPLRDWGKYRWQDNVYSVLWLYNRTGDASLLNLARLLHKQGYDWEAQFADFRYKEKLTSEKLGLLPKRPIPEMAMQTHGVNNAMALKVAPIWWLVSGQASDRSSLKTQLRELDQFHGLPNGMFSGDEHLAGPDPSQGIELCAVVESMFSYETAFSILGDGVLADRLERITYNALPATLSNDMWSHQYDQQPNQIACTRAHRQWSTNGDDSNLFGLEPNFGCCTANLHQGWPKFVSSLWMATPDGGLATVSYGPSEVTAKVRGGEVKIRENTDYPFRGNIELLVTSQGVREFPLVLRIPAWAKNTEVKINGASLAAVTSATTQKGFYTIRRHWRGGDRIDVIFEMEPRTTHWYRNSAVFERGPLVFSLPLDGEWNQLKQYAQKSADWELRSDHPWNYAVAIGECDAQVTESPLGETAFDVKQSAVQLQIQATRLPEWTESENSAGVVPISPVNGNSSGKLSDLTLIPYGSAKLRITAFPYLRQSTHCGTASSMQPKRIGE